MKFTLNNTSKNCVKIRKNVSERFKDLNVNAKTKYTNERKIDRII